MGGIMSGGHNREHDYTDRYKRLDSYEFSKCFPIMERKGMEQFKHTATWKDGSSIGLIVHNGSVEVGYSVESDGERESIRETFYFEAVPNNYGGADRHYFICPYCGRRARLLYLHRLHFKCRKCAGLNYQSQQVSKGWDAAIYRLNKFLKVNFNITGLAPCDSGRITPPRPKGMHERTYRKLLIELEELQNEQTKGFMSGLARFGIFPQ